jgi:2-polyprenyl-6-methoxyphenol hydroxylase-like FAD-dependent oxidoreductase
MKALIIGGGIGGLTTALALHGEGIDCEIFEQSQTLHELGVGINLLPHATKVLAGLGLLDGLDRVAVRTYELVYLNRFGQELWRELRGCHAGHDFPQFSIHRGRLQGVLYEAAKVRLGQRHIHTGHRLSAFVQDAQGVTATFALRGSASDAAAAGNATVTSDAAAAGDTATVRGDFLIAADGIHSTVRAALYPSEGPPAWNGVMLWRGAVRYQPFLTGRTMIISGGMKAKLVLYPIANEEGGVLHNWAVAAKISDGATPPPRREDWSRSGRLDELLPNVESVFRLPIVNPVDIIRATPEFYEYPMCDRDPLPRWSFDRVTLLGDAAHPMYPVGSNGASQAILDAQCLRRHLVEQRDVKAALVAYDEERRPATARIVHDNRSGGPERVIDMVEQRAPEGFARLQDIASHEELEAIVKGYSKMAGFDRVKVQ